MAVNKGVTKGILPGVIVNRGTLLPPDWSTYTGANNGVATNDASIINRSGWMVGISDTQILYVANEQSTLPDLVSRVITRNGTNITIGSPTTLISDMATGLYNQPEVKKLSATRYLTIGEHHDAGDLCKLFLLDETGAKIAESTVPGETVQATSMSIAVHSATKVVITFADTVGKDPHLVACDLTGDAFSWGTPITVATTAASYTEICALTATVGHVSHKNRVWRYTVSGTTVTLGNSTRMETSVGDSSNGGGRAIVRLDDTHSMVIYKQSSTALPMAIIITDATTPTTSNSPFQIDTETIQGWPIGIADVKGDGTTFLVCYGRGVVEKYAKSVVLTVDHSDWSISKSANVQVSGNLFADHVTCAAFGTSGYALCVWQDDANSNELGYALLAGG